MKSKHIIILALILVFLTGGIIFRKMQHRPELATHQFLPLDMEFDSEQISKISIFKPAAGVQKESRVELIKENGIWKVKGVWAVRADQERVDSFLREIKKSKGELRSSTRETHGDFKISEQQAVHVKLASASGKEMLNFLIGAAKSGYGGLFVRKQNSDEVYLTEADYYGQMGLFGDPETETLDEGYWALRKYAFFDPAIVEKIEIHQYGKGAQPSVLALEKTQDGWRYADQNLPFPPDAEKISLYLNVVKNSAADKVVDPKARDYGFQKPRARVILMLRSGAPKEFTVGDADSAAESAFYLQSSGEDAVFLVSKYVLENIAVSAEWFMRDNPLGADNTKIEKITVHADKYEKTFQPLLKKWPTLETYMEGLKSFKVEKPAGGKARFGKFWIAIQKTGETEPVIIDAAENPVTVDGKVLHPAQKRGTTYLFSITSELFAKLFENPSRLDEPR